MIGGKAATRTYIGAVRWQYARTMPDWPHEYTVKSWRPDLAVEFELFCELIARDGFVEPWPPLPHGPIYHNHYFVVDEHKYWAMGPRGDLDTPSEKTVMNRTRLGPDRKTGRRRQRRRAGPR